MGEERPDDGNEEEEEEDVEEADSVRRLLLLLLDDTIDTKNEVTSTANERSGLKGNRVIPSRVCPCEDLVDLVEEVGDDLADDEASELFSVPPSSSSTRFAK